MATIFTGPFITMSSFTVQGGNLGVGGDARISGNTSVSGQLLIGGDLLISTLSYDGITLTGNINLAAGTGITLCADSVTNTLTISGGGGGGGGNVFSPLTESFNVSTFPITSTERFVELDGSGGTVVRNVLKVSISDATSNSNSFSYSAETNGINFTIDTSTTINPNQWVPIGTSTYDHITDTATLGPDAIHLHPDGTVAIVTGFSGGAVPSVVTSISAGGGMFTNSLELIAGPNITLTSNGNTLTISGAAGGSGFVSPAVTYLDMSGNSICNVDAIYCTSPAVIYNVSAFTSIGTDWTFICNVGGGPYDLLRISGGAGAISNANTSSNTIGSVTLNTGAITAGLPGTAGNLAIVDGATPFVNTTFNVQGGTGTVTATGSITSGFAGTPSFVTCSTGTTFGAVQPSIGYTGSNSTYSPDTAQIGTFGTPITYFTGTVPTITPPATDANMTFNYLQGAGAVFAVGIFTYREIGGSPGNAGISCLYQKSGTNTYLTANYASGGGVGYPGYVSIDSNGTITLLSQNAGATYVASFVSFYLFA
jgi:hypothetical protein